MAVQRLARWSLSITMLFAVVPAVAQTNSPTTGAGGGGKFRAACGEDLQRFCAGVQPGGGRLVQCLSSHTNELSAACGNVIAVAGRGGAKIHAACDQDLQRFCVGVQPGRGRLIQCLSSRTSELSIACGNMIAAIQARKDTFNASAQSPATQPAAPATIGHSRVTIGPILRASCGPDVQRLCAGARRESEVLNCLDSQRTGLSTTCSMYFQNLDARPTAQENAPNKKRPSPPPTTPIPVQENAQNKKPPSPPPTTPIPVQENAENKTPSPPPTTPIPVQENAQNKKPPSPPPTTPIPD
jgi:Cysteine rich repeat